MKRTEYFATIEEANQYYPDGVPSGVIAIVGDGSQVLVSSDNAATNTQQYYSADLTNDDIVNTMVQDSYDEGHSDGYAEGVADGQAEATTNWIDVLYLDEKAKAESFLGVTFTDNSFIKCNFADSAILDQTSALGFIAGLQDNKTMFKLIKISKDANGNAVITYNPCSINFDGTNVGSFELDSNTYNTKICIWGTLTLAVDDEVIMDCATFVSNTNLGLFGGYDANSSDPTTPTTFKCATAGTYTFGVWVDVPQVQNGEAACFVSTAFNYTGSATVPAIAVPTGEPTGGSGEPTIEELNNMSMGAVLMSLYGTGTQSIITMQLGDLDYLDAESAKAAMDATNLQFTVDKYNETDGLTIDNSFTFDTDNSTYMNVQVSLDAGDKVGFSLTPANSDAMGDYLFDHPCSWLFRYVGPDNTGMGYNTHWFDVQNTGNYKFEITFGTDPESGDSTVEGYTFTEVVQP